MGKEIVHREGAEKNLKHGGKEEAEEHATSGGKSYRRRFTQMSADWESELGRLIEFLTALGQDVKITVTPARKQQGQLSVVVA
jgi:hypothetical protein